jgi:ribonuclease P protein component
MRAAPKVASAWLSNFWLRAVPAHAYSGIAGVPTGGGTVVQRLKTRPQFQAVLAGHTIARTAHFALHCCSLDAPVSVVNNPGVPALFPVQRVWLGAMVPKRWAKRSVTRNAIKRQIYNVSADFEPRLPARAHVVRLRASFDRAAFVSASSDVLKAAVRAELHQLFLRVAPLPDA